MPNQPIPVIQAQAMLKAYNAYMQKLGVDMQKQTQSVSFKLPELMEWLTKMTGLADEIRICMGDYPEGHPQAGRTTVVLWPYMNGQPAQYPAETSKTGFAKTDGTDTTDGGDGRDVDPYNEGQLYP